MRRWQRAAPGRHVTVLCRTQCGHASHAAALHASPAWRTLQEQFARPAATSDTAELSFHPSRIPTRHFQLSLPRLPVPRLAATLRRYEAAVAPLLPPAQMTRTSAIVAQFARDAGPRLQDELLRTDRANRHTSYIASDLLEHTLRSRQALPLRSHRSLLVRPDATKRDMLLRATFWVQSSVLYHKLYMDDQLAPAYANTSEEDDLSLLLESRSGGKSAEEHTARRAWWRRPWFEAQLAACPEFWSTALLAAASRRRCLPRDLSSYDNLFNTTRLPGVLQDEIRAVGFQPHIVVQYHGHQFIVNVADAAGVPLAAQEIYARLRDVVQSAVTPPTTDIGLLSALPRSEWNATRAALLRHVANQTSFEAVEGALFVLHLADEVMLDEGSAGEALRRLACPGWWDKSLVVTVTRDGSVAVHYERSWCDGPAVRRYGAAVCAHSAAQSATALRRDAPALEPLRQLRWVLPTEVAATARQARLRLAHDHTQRLDTQCTLLYHDTLANHEGDDARTGQPACAGQSAALTEAAVSAQAHMAVHLAWWRLTRGHANVVEEFCQDTFRRGRFDMLRSLSAAGHASLLAMLPTLADGGPVAPGSSAAATQACHATACTGAELQRYKYAMAAHYRNARSALRAGQGADCHLTALRTVAERLYGSIPDFFHDTSFATFAEPVVQLHTMSSPYLLHAATPPTETGYGVSVCWLGEHAVQVQVSCWRDGNGPRYTAAEFLQAVCDAWRDLRM